jgi:hypothetical protein
LNASSFSSFFRIIPYPIIFRVFEQVYYKNNIIKEADAETFELIGKLKTFGKDKNNYYNTDRIISKERFEKLKTELENGVWHNCI